METVNTNSLAGRSRRASTIALAGTLTVALFGCAGAEASPGDESAAEIPGLMNQGELSVCTIDYYPPMEYIDDNGDLVGFDVDMVDAIAESMGLEARYVVMRFEGLMPGLDTGRCDLATAAMYLNEDRQESADAIPYMSTTAQLMVAAGNPKNMHTLEDLSGKVMAIDAGTSNLAIAETLSQELVDKGLAPMEILQFPSAPDTFQQIRVGRADGVIEADVVVGWTASQEPDALEYVRFQDEADGTFAMYTKKGNGLAEHISEAVQELYDAGTLHEYAEKYGLDTLNLDQALGG